MKKLSCEQLLERASLLHVKIIIKLKKGKKEGRKKERASLPLRGTRPCLPGGSIFPVSFLLKKIIFMGMPKFLKEKKLVQNNVSVIFRDH